MLTGVRTMQRMCSAVLALMVSASTQFIFQPPAGWQHVGSTEGGLGTWLHHGDEVYSQNVSAQATPFSGKLSEIVSKEITYIQGTFANVTMKSIERTTICDKHPAAYITYTFDTQATQVVAEQIVTIYGSTAYTAKYNRAADQQPDHPRSIHCGRSVAASRPAASEREDVEMSRLVLLIACSLIAFGCAKSDSGKQSATAPSATPMAAATPAANDLMAKLPVYPGSALAASQAGTIAGKHVMVQQYTTRDPFDKVYKWYQAAMPAHSETSHDTSQSQESAVFTLTGGAKQQSVSVLKTGGVEVTNITLTLTGE